STARSSIRAKPGPTRPPMTHRPLASPACSSTTSRNSRLTSKKKFWAPPLCCPRLPSRLDTNAQASIFCRPPLRRPVSFDGDEVAMAEGTLEVRPGIWVDEDELSEQFIRSSGPGGQNANKVATAVQLRFSVTTARHRPEPVR